LEGRDDVLGRAVWIYRGPRAVDDLRRRVVRPTRPHWLQGGEQGNDRWDAFEAVVGAPLTEIARQPGGASWHEGRFWLLDLSEELAAAVSDATLPQQLSLDQVWIARGGRLKLLDSPLTQYGTTAGAGPAPCRVHSGAADPRAVGLLHEAVLLCTRRQVLPLAVLNFADELAARPATCETLVWAAQWLREAVTQPAALSWDDRLGILAVSMGTELSFYTAFAVGLPLLLAAFSLPVAKVVLLAPLGLLVPALVGFAFRGGPVFWLTRIDVLRSDGRRASRWQCGWRSLLAWAPIIVFYGLLGMLAAKMGVTLLGGDGAVPAGQLSDDPTTLWPFLGGVCVGELLGLLFFIGAVYAVARPQRGLQDLLSGTWLAPH